MVKRNIQFFRNTTVMGNYGTHQDAITGAENKFRVIAQDPGLLDGEIVLYRYAINNSAEIHTIVGVVCEKNGSKHIEILGNYDILNGEIAQALADAKAYTDAQIQDLDTIVSSDESKPVVVKITQTDGKIASVEVTTDIDVTGQIEAALAALDGTATIATQDANGNVTLKAGIVEEDGIIKNDNSLADIKLAKVATSGKAEDVSVADSDNVITATTVEGALVEIAKEIDAMTMTESSVVALANDGSALNYSNIKQENGQVKITDKQQLIKFKTAYNADNNLVATMSDVTTAVNNVAYTEGTNVKIDSDRKINVPLGLVYDKDAKKIYLVNDKNATSATTENIIDDINATDFVVDGMLSNAELKYGTLNGETFTPSDNGEPYLVLTFNADGTTQGAKTIYVPVKDLVDVYTGDETYITVENYTIKHNVQNVDTGNSYTTTITGEIAGANDNQGRLEGQTIHGSDLTFTVPSLKVDKAGHIVELKTKKIKFILPPHPTASHITITDTANNFTATNVEDALAELAGNITTGVNGIKNYAKITAGGTSITPSTNADELTFEGDVIISIKAESDADKLTFSHKKVEPETIETTDSTSTTIEVPVLEFDPYGHISKKGIQKYIITIPAQLTSSVAAGNGITVTPSTEGNNTEYKVEVKLNPNTNDMLTVDANGLNLSNSWDCGEY